MEEGPQLILLLLLGSPPRQEPEKGPTVEIHTHPAGAVTGSGAVDESSDSEAEQEGPQKLIRKVSTSGQIRSKVRPPDNCCISSAAFCSSDAQRVKKQTGGFCVCDFKAATGTHSETLQGCFTLLLDKPVAQIYSATQGFSFSTMNIRLLLTYCISAFISSSVFYISSIFVYLFIYAGKG